MKVLCSAIISILIITGSFTALFAQDSDPVKDTTNQDQITALIRKIDSIKATDSVKRVALLEEINKLKGSDRQRRTLLKQLNAVEREDSLHQARLTVELNKLRADSIGYAVIPFFDTLFVIHTRVGSFSARERAESISNRIEKLYRDFQFHPDSLRVIVNESSADIVFRDLIIMTVNELEAAWYNLPQEEIAQKYSSIIAHAIKTHREENELVTIGTRIGEAALIVIAIILIVLLINYSFRLLKRRLFKVKSSILDGVTIHGYKFLDRHGELQFILFFMKFFRGLLILISIYFALPLLFGLFPGTEYMAKTMLDWILEPLFSLYDAIVEFLPNLFTILVIFTVIHYLILFLRFIANEIDKGGIAIPGFYPDWAKPTFALVRVLLLAFGFIVIFPYLPGSHSSVFRGVSVFLGLLFSLGSTSAVSNAVAGFVITYMRPFKVGDRIKIGEVTGDVIEKSMLVTRLRTIKNEEITIPNSSVLSGHTLNYTSSAKDLGLILYTSVTISYDAPWQKVHELLIGAALITEGISKDENHKPFVFQTNLNDFYVTYQINAYTHLSNEMDRIYSELHQNIQNQFNQAGVEILSPHYRALRDGGKTTISS